MDDRQLLEKKIVLLVASYQLSYFPASQTFTHRENKLSIRTVLSFNTCQYSVQMQTKQKWLNKKKASNHLQNINISGNVWFIVWFKKVMFISILRSGQVCTRT